MCLRPQTQRWRDRRVFHQRQVHRLTRAVLLRKPGSNRFRCTESTVSHAERRLRLLALRTANGEPLSAHHPACVWRACDRMGPLAVEPTGAVRQTDTARAQAILVAVFRKHGRSAALSSDMARMLYPESLDGEMAP